MPVTGLRSSRSPPTGYAALAKAVSMASRTRRTRSGPCSTTGPLRLASASPASLFCLRPVAGEEQRLGECQLLDFSRAGTFVGGVHESRRAPCHAPNKDIRNATRRAGNYDETVRLADIFRGRADRR